MTHTKDEIISMIDLDEPDYYSIVSEFSPGDTSILIELAQDNRPRIATKAIACLGLLDDNAALDGIKKAAEHPDPIYRLAAATALKNKQKIPEAINILENLLDDADNGVKKFAIKSVPVSADIKLKNRLDLLSQQSNNKYIRALAKEKLFNINNSQ
jgi:hypothetical protein